MFRKILGLFIFLVTALQATPTTTEIRAGYFYPTAHLYKKIYGGQGYYSAEINVKAYQGLEGFFSLGYTPNSGLSLDTPKSTSIYMIPITGGLKYFFKVNSVKPYLGFGMNLAYAHLRNQYDYVVKKQDGWALGFIAKSGLFFKNQANFVFDFFFDYSYLKKDFYAESDLFVRYNEANLSGLIVGGSVGYQF